MKFQKRRRLWPTSGCNAVEEEEEEEEEEEGRYFTCALVHKHL
jgi:hypothetical protein